MADRLPKIRERWLCGETLSSSDVAWLMAEVKQLRRGERAADAEIERLQRRAFTRRDIVAALDRADSDAVALAQAALVTAYEEFDDLDAHAVELVRVVLGIP